MGLQALRKEIDSLDEELLRVLARRFSLLPKIAKLKREKGLSPKQFEREKEMVEARKALAKSIGIDETFSKRLFLLILEESLKIQQPKE